jgi:hypothetical protein
MASSSPLVASTVFPWVGEAIAEGGALSLDLACEQAFGAIGHGRWPGAALPHLGGGLTTSAK